jgi:nucleotide-binding universal stress UspA family protein
MFDRILVPLDGTPPETIALTVACTLAQVYRSQIVLLRVVDTTAKRYDADNELERIAAEFASSSVSITRHVWISGDVATQIVHAAKHMCADLVIMAIRGHRASRALRMGSVTEAVVAQSAVPVLVVPI